MDDVFEACGDLVVVRDATGRVERVNAAFRRAMGGEPEDWSGRWFALGPLRHDAPDPTSGRTRYETDLETIIGPLSVEWEESRLPNGGSVAIGRDVTARRVGEAVAQDARQAAEADARAKDTLLAAVTHELRTPASGMLGMAELLRASALSSEQASHVDALSVSARHLLRLIDDILDAARLEAGSVIVSHDDVDVAQIVEEVVELSSPAARAKGLEIGAYVDPALPQRSRLDAARFRQIAFNLIGNAVKFTRAGGVGVAVEPARVGDVEGVRLTVTDSGPGVPPGAEERIFDAFDRGNADPGAPGAGLGLAIVSKLASAMGGSVRHERPESGGARFVCAVAAPALMEATANRPARRHRTVALHMPPSPARDALARQCLAHGAERVVNPGKDEGPHDVDVAIIDAAVGQCPPMVAGRRVLALAIDDRSRLATLNSDGFDAYLLKPWRAAAVARALGSTEAASSTAQGPQPECAARRSDEGEAGPQRSTRAPRVLLVEDDPVNALLAQTLMRRAGCVVTHVGDGAAAVESARDAQYDLVLMDMRLPGLNGCDAARAIRQGHGARWRIVGLTANAAPEDRQACRDAGMDAVRIKPLTPEALDAELAAIAPPSDGTHLERDAS